MVKKTEEFVDLLFGKVGVVAGVFHFKGVDVFAFSRHYVWEGVEAGVADGDADGVVAFFLQEFNQDGFAVEASFAPTPKFDSVNFGGQQFPLLNACIYGVLEIKIVPLEHCKTVFGGCFCIL